MVRISRWIPSLGLALLTLVTAAGAAPLSRSGPDSGSGSGEGPAPEGYRWEPCAAVDRPVLVPDRWLLRTDHRSEGAGESVTCRITDEPPGPGEPGRSATGITITRRRGLTVGLGPREHALRAIERLVAGREVVDRSSQVRDSLFVERVEVVDRSLEVPRHTWVLFVADVRAGVLSTVVLEAPESAWETSRTLMDPVLRSIRFTAGR